MRWAAPACRTGLFLLAMSLARLGAASEQKPTTVIHNVTVLSADAGSLRRFLGDVAVRDGIIIHAGPHGPAGDVRIDGTGKFLMPGLIDSHVHLGRVVGLREADFEAQAGLVAQYLAQEPKSYLFHGVTTVIDLGDLSARTRRRFEAGGLHPRVYGVGAAVRYLDGYGQSFFPKPERYAIFPNWVGDGAALPSGADPARHSPEAAVDFAVERGAIAIKTFHEDGFGGTFSFPVPSPDLLARTAAAAHARRLPLVLHATSLDAYRQGILAGADILAHGLWHWGRLDLSTRPPAAFSDMAAQLAARQIYVQSTMRVAEGEAQTYRWDSREIDAAADMLGPDWLAWFRSPRGQWPRDAVRALYAQKVAGSGQAPADYVDVAAQRSRATLGLMAARQVKLILGSDTPTSDGFSTLPGRNTYLELRAMADAGVSLEQIFLAATWRNARAFGLDATLGTIEPGKAADLLLLSADPLRAIDAYERIDTVFAAGRALARSRLSAARH